MKVLPKFLNKKISTQIGVAIIVFFAILAGGFLIWQCRPSKKGVEIEMPHPRMPEPVEVVRSDLAEYLDVKPSSIKVLKIEEVVWPNTCLGLIAPELCAPGETLGYRVILVAFGQEYVYHTDKSETFRYAGPGDFPQRPLAEINTSDWKTYKNAEHGFEIRYPSEWEIEATVIYPSLSIDFLRKTLREDVDFWIGINFWFDRPIAPMCRFAGEEISAAGNRVSPETVSYFKSKPSNIEEMSGEEFRRVCQTQPLGDDHSVYLDMCFDENLGYLGNYCEEGSGNFYYQFDLHCKGEKWQGREGMDKCSQLFNSILSTFRFLEEEEEAK